LLYKKIHLLLSLLAKGSIFLTTAVALDGGDVLVEGLGLPLVGQVDVDVAVLGFKLGLEKNTNSSKLLYG
jgi:hypothetical protein